MKKETLLAILGEVLDEVKIMEADVAFEHGDGCEHNVASAKLATIIKIAERETIEDSPKNDLKAVSSDFVASDDKLSNRDDGGSEKANTEAVLVSTKGLAEGTEKLFAIDYHPGDTIWCFFFKTDRSLGVHLFIGTEPMFEEYKQFCKEFAIHFMGVEKIPALGRHVEEIMEYHEKLLKEKKLPKR